MNLPSETEPPKTRDNNHFRKFMFHHAQFGTYTISIGVLLLIVLIVLHNTCYQRSDEYLWGALISIPVTIFCMGGFSVFYEWYLRNKFTEAMRSVNDSWDTGVHVLTSHKAAPNRLDELKKAKKTVKLMSTTFSQYFPHVGGTREIEKLIEEKNVKFKFIIYEPNCAGVNEKAYEENTNPKKFNDEIISTCCSFLGPLRKKYPGDFEVRFCPFNTPFGITVIDDVKMILSLNIFGLVREKKETPCLIIQNRYESDSVFKQYDNSFDAIWKKLPDIIPDSVQKCFNEQ